MFFLLFRHSLSNEVGNPLARAYSSPNFSDIFFVLSNYDTYSHFISVLSLPICTVEDHPPLVCNVPKHPGFPENVNDEAGVGLNSPPQCNIPGHPQLLCNLRHHPDYPR